MGYGTALKSKKKKECFRKRNTLIWDIWFYRDLFLYLFPFFRVFWGRIT